MPPLPRKLNKREAAITPKILKWLRANHPESAAIEIKATDKGTIPRGALQSHQEAALFMASHGTLCHKISDAGHTRNPFDAFVLHKVPAYVVAAFTARGVAYIIPIADWNGAAIGMTKYRFKISL